MQSLPSSNALTLGIDAVSSNTIALTFNGVESQFSTGNSNTIYGIWTFYGYAQDNTTGLAGITGLTGTNTIISSNTLRIDPALSPTSISSPASRETLDSGQSYPISISIPTTGTSPYTYSWSIANGYSCPGFSSPGNVTSFIYYPSTASSVTCEFSATIIDSATTPESYTLTTPAITVNPASTISLSPSNTLLDSGQIETYILNILGGTGPFNAMLWNVTGNRQMGSNVIIQLSGSNAVSFAVNSPTSANVFVFNAIAYDTGTAQPFVFNSLQNTITVNSAPVLLLNSIQSINPSNVLSQSQPLSVIYGVLPSISANTVGGTGPFSYNWIITDSSGVQILSENQLANFAPSIETAANSITAEDNLALGVIFL
jgi:hypothetical protein